MTSDGRSGRPIVLAAVAGAHGIKGEVRLKLFTSTPHNLERASHLYVGGVATKLKKLQRSGKTFIAQFEGCSDRGNAEALRGALIEVDRSALPPLDEGEYYHADLLGLPVVGAEGKRIGIIVAVENYGAGDLLEVEKDDGTRSLIPFREGIADLIEGEMVVDREFLA